MGDGLQAHAKTLQHNGHSWVSIISTYAKQRQFGQVINIFQQMQCTGMVLDKVIFIIILKACASVASLEWGKRVHAYIIKCGFKLDLAMGSTLVHMYAKCGSIDDAHRVFNKMHERNVVSWTALVTGYAQQGHGEKALMLLEQMQWEGVKPNNITFFSILKACASLAALEWGKQVHVHAINNGFESDVLVGNALVDMYAKYGTIKDAWQAFKKIHERNVVSWNSIIAGYARQGQGQDCLRLFEQMQEEGVKPNSVTFVSMLKVCANLGAMEWGKQVHTNIIVSGFESDVFVGSTLIDMYAKCGSIDDARKAFNKIHIKNVVSWTAMIAGYVQQERSEEALALFEEMQQKGVEPNNFTFVSVLKACTSLTALGRGRQVHAHAIKSGFESDVFVGNTLIDMYAKCGSIEDAYQVFIEMHEHDIVSWNAMITGYVQQGLCKEALGLYKQMQQKGLKPNNITFVSILKACVGLAALDQGKQIHAQIIKDGFELDLFVASTLVDMYGKCGSIEKAHNVFKQMPERNIVSWNAMIAGYVQQGYSKEALMLFKQMQQEGLKPNKVTFLSILKACGSSAALELGKQVHAQIIKSCSMLDVHMENALLDMYAKCGSIDDARQVFNNMCEQDVVAWNSMLGGYAQQGHAKEVLILFEQMQQRGKKPGEITFICLLAACCHAGLVDDGYHYFNSMTGDHCIIPTMEHYACMVDLLGRAGHVDEANDVLNKMQIGPNIVVWMTLLDACRTQGNVELGRHAFESIFQLQPMCDGAYVLLSNIYAMTGRWDEIAKLRKQMEDAGVSMKEVPRCSWIEIDDKLHTFTVGDRPHSKGRRFRIS